MKTPPAPKLRSKLLKVPAGELGIHPNAQRELVPSRLKKLVADLDLDAIGVLHAVEYPIKGVKKIWVIDGQHRLRAILEHGFAEWPVEVKIHVDVDNDSRASELFLRLNDRSPVRPYDKFVNELRAKDDESVAVNDIVISHGLKVSGSAIDGHIVGIQALKKSYRLDGDGKALDKSLGVITQAWGKRSVDAKIIEGVSQLFNRFNGNIDQAAFVKKLAKYPGSAPGLVGDARGLMSFRSASLSRCIAECLLETYNSGRRIGRLEAL